MYKKRILKTYNQYSYTFSLSDFSRGVNKEIEENLLNINYAQSAYNVKTDDKSLKNCYGISNFSMPNSIFDKENIFKVPQGVKPLGVWTCKVMNSEGKIDDLMILYGDNKKLYFSFLYGPTDQFFDTGVELNAKPSILHYVYNGLDSIVMTSPSDPLYVWNTSTPQPSDKGLHLTSITSHYERIFATSSDEKRRVRFSQDFDILNWGETSQEGGFIELVDERGDLKKAISFNDYVYLIREFGISRLSAYGDQSDFSITHLHSSNSKIYDNTAVLCGDRIIYLSQEGLKYIYGSATYDYDFKINSMVDKENISHSTACYFNGKYYLATRLNFDDNSKIGCENEENYKNNALIEYDLKTQKLNIMRGIDISHLCPVAYENKNKLVLCFNGEKGGQLGQLDEYGAIFEEKIEKKWQTPMSDLGLYKVKVVKLIKLLTKHNLKLKVFSENESQIVQVNASPKMQEIPINVVGFRIGVEISTTENLLNISNPIIKLDSLED